MHDGSGTAGEREVDVVDDEAVRGGCSDERGGEARGVGGGVTQGGEQVGVGGVVGRFELVVEFFGEGLGEGEGGQAVERSFPGPGDGAAGDDEPQGGVKAYVDAAEDCIDRGGPRYEVIESDVHAITRGAVDDPGGATEATISLGGVDGSVAGFGGADPALFGLGCSDVGRVARSAQGRDEFVQEGAGDAVVVSDQ